MLNHANNYVGNAFLLAKNSEVSGIQVKPLQRTVTK